jgi:hypothetical protein
MKYIPSSNEMANVVNTLQKGNIGYHDASVPFQGVQTGVDTYTATNLSPLVPQQLQQTLSVATSTMADLKLWPMIAKAQARNTVVEYNRVLSHGGEFSPFIAEGGSASLNRAKYEKVAVQIRYLAEKRAVTDVAMNVTLNAPSADAIAEETRRGTEDLLRRVEKELFHGDSSLNDLAWDGIIKQIKDAGNVADLRGSAPSAVYLSEILGALYSAPFYGMVNAILVTPRVLSELIKQTVHHGRHDQLQVNGGSVTFGASELSITSPYGAVKVIACPFLERQDRLAPPAGSSSVFEGAVVTPTINAQPTSPADNASKFVNADAGVYHYRVVPVGDAGVGIPVDTNPVALDPGDKVTFQIAQGDAKATVKFYKIYRSAKDASDANGAKLVGEVACAGATTTFEDFNNTIPGTSDIVFINNAPDYMEYFQMLSLVRRPLAQVNTSYPFLLMMFGAPAVKLPSKMFVVRNAGANESSGLIGVLDGSLIGLHQ